VLLVQDDPGRDDEMAAYLGRAGYFVERATTGVEALVRMRRRLPDLVVLDLELPLMSGAELIASARRDRRLATVPYVLLSAASSLPMIAAALGARAALAKPVDLDVLLAVVNRASRS
jgi:DNA-binding response OmpR family regulator